MRTRNCFTMLMIAVLGLLPSLAPAGELIQPGESLPELRGRFLSGRDAVLPDSCRGRVALLAMGFTRGSQSAVEDWSNRFRKEFEADSGVTWYEIPVIGGLARLARPFIDSGMRRATPPGLHENVITVYRQAGEWKGRLGYSEGHFAYILLLDPSGRVAWRHAGSFDESHYATLAKTARRLMEAR